MYKNGDQPMPLRDRNSYYEDFETNNLSKAEKGKTHSNDMSALFKNSAENNNGAVVGQKRPITNNDGGTNTQAKVPCCQNPAKTTSEDEVDLEILNQVYQEHQIPQNLGDAISERLSSVIKNTGHTNLKILAILENYMKNYKIVEIYAPLS